MGTKKDKKEAIPALRRESKYKSENFSREAELGGT
jgi:hypothetical protein